MQSTLLTSSRPAAVAALLLALISQLGCEPSASPPAADRGPRKVPAIPAPPSEPEPSDEDALPPPTKVAAGVKSWIAFDQLPWEAWYLQYLDGKRIGYSHVHVDQSTLHSDSKLINIRRTDCIEVVGNGTQAIFKRTIDSKEYNDGRLISMSDVSQSLDNVAKTEGTMTKNTFNATTTIGEAVTTNAVAWDVEAWGLMGLQAILMQRPPQPGELLEAQVFIPQLYKIAKAELLAGQPDVTTLPGGRTESLLPVEVILWTEDSGLRSRNWINAKGEVLKTISLSGPSMSTFWTPAEVAHRVRDELELAEQLRQRVELQGGEISSGAQQALYGVSRSAESTGAEVYSLLAKSPLQTVTSLNALTAEATVKKLALDQLSAAAEPTQEEAPDHTFRGPSPLLPADNPELKQWAAELLLDPSGNNSIGADMENTLSTALQLTSELHTRVTVTPLDREVASPLQTIRQLKGDCVDQALLLTTLLRSQQIPARVASGLAIDPENKLQMRFAMWTEAWLAGRWVGLDATTGQIVAVDRLKILASDLAGENPYVAILPVFRELSGLQVKILSAQ